MANDGAIVRRKERFGVGDKGSSKRRSTLKDANAGDLITLEARHRLRAVL